MSKKVKKLHWWATIKPKTGFQLALVVLFLLSMVVGVWAISASQEIRSQAAGKKVKTTCASNSDAVCKGKKIGQEVRDGGQVGKCVSKKSKIQAGENVKCVFQASETKPASTPVDAPVKRNSPPVGDGGEDIKPTYDKCDESKTNWAPSLQANNGENIEWCRNNDGQLRFECTGRFQWIDNKIRCL